MERGGRTRVVVVVEFGVFGRGSSEMGSKAAFGRRESDGGGDFGNGSGRRRRRRRWGFGFGSEEAGNHLLLLLSHLDTDDKTGKVPRISIKPGNIRRVHRSFIHLKG